MREFSDSTEAITELAACSARFPQLRLCQIIVAATGRSDPFYVTDAELNTSLRRFRKEHALPSEDSGA